MLLTLLLSPSAGASDTLDSLKGIHLQSMDYEEKIKVLKSILLHSVNDDDSTIFYGNRLLEEAREADHPNRFWANVYLGQAYKSQGSYESALEYLFEALRVGEHLTKKDVAMVNSLIGTLYGKIGDVEKLAHYFNLCIGQYETGDHQDSVRQVIAFNNLAEGYYNNDYLDSSLKYYQKAEFFAQELKREYLTKVITGNIGMVNARLGNLDLAEEQLADALEYKSSMGNDAGTITTYQFHLADVYFQKNQINQARELVEEALELAHQRGLKEQISDGSLKMSELYTHVGDFEKALQFYQQHIVYRDSIRNLAMIQSLADMRTRYEVGQKQAEVDVLTAEKRIQQLIMLAIGAFALVLVVLAGIIYKYYQTKSRINRELESLNQTKDKFFSIISHDLRGPVSSFFGISRMIKFLVQTKETEQLMVIADDIDESVERLSNLLDNLLTWAMQQQGHFPNNPEKLRLEEMADEIVKTLSNMAKAKNVELSARVAENLEVWADKNMTMTILRNLVNNALKFTPEKGQVRISAKAVNGLAVIRIADSGVGIPKSKLDMLFKFHDKKSTYGTAGEKGLGLGLQLVHEFVEMNGGSIDVETAESMGTTFIVRLPLAPS